jgi:ABC-2 type transport system permease protein
MENDRVSLSAIIRLFLKYSRLLVKSNFQYRLNAFLLSFGVFIREMINIVVIYLLFKHFLNLNGWTLNEMLFLFSLLFLSYSLLVLFFTGVRDFSSLVHSGQFDRYLVRPVGLLFQIIASRADYFASIGHGAVGILLFLSTANSVGIRWTPVNVLYYSLMVTGGVMIQLSIWLLTACLSFWTIKSNSIIGFLFWNVRKFAGYPVSIFPAFIRILLMFVIPFAFVNYFPAQYFLRKPDMSVFPDFYLFLTPIVGFTMFVIVQALWKVSLRHYASTGTEM